MPREVQLRLARLLRPWPTPEPSRFVQPLVAAALCCLLGLLAFGHAPPAHALVIVAGNAHSLLLRDDATLWAWGQGGNGQLGDGSAGRSAPVQTLSGIKAVAAGDHHTLVLKMDGTLWAFGWNRYGQIGDGTIGSRAAPVQVMSNVRAIGAGFRHSLAIKTDGTLWAWGANESGQLGDGTQTIRPTPVQVMSDVKTVAGGFAHTLAIKTDGTLYAWGANSSGQLGDGTFVARRIAPVRITNGIEAIAAGSFHSLALGIGGAVLAWGDNFRGQLGDGSDVARETPTIVMSGALAIAARGDHSMVLRSTTLWAWGANEYGQVGDGSTIDRFDPVQVATGVQAIAAGTLHSVAVDTSGLLLAWGANFSGQLGDGSTVWRAGPIQVIGNAQAIGAGDAHSLVVRTDATVWTWGWNELGQLGDGSTVSRATPMQVLSNAKAVAGGTYHSLALKVDGTVWAWGSNESGQIGNGAEANRPVPTLVLSGAQAIAAGGSHSLALKTDGTVWAWGENAFGQLGDGTTANRSTPVQVLAGVQAIAAGSVHSLAIKSDGTLWAWGRNNFGQIGDGTTLTRNLPVQVQTGVLAVSSSGYHVLALKAGGTLWAWGLNGFGQLGNGTTGDRGEPAAVLQGVQSFAAGSFHSLALKPDGTVWAWGLAAIPGSPGLVTRPQLHPFLPAIGALAAGSTHALALAVDGRVYAWGSNALQEIGIPRVTNTTTPAAVRDPLAPFAKANAVLEFFNPTIRNGAGTAGIGHHFLTAVTAEMASIDAGGSGPDWTRTGRGFRAWLAKADAPAGAVSVHRFYAREPNSHFYTASEVEYLQLRLLNPTNNPNLGWADEGIAFHAVVPSDGQCPAGYLPVYRAYNQRFNPDPALNDGNHRITPSYNDYSRAVRYLGYADEGIALCSPANQTPGGDLQVTYTFPGATVDSGAPVHVEFLYGNNGAGKGDGGSIYAALPKTLAWSVTCTARLGATCPPPSSLTAESLRVGLAVTEWPPGGTLNVTATGIAPPINATSNAELDFAATVANASGSLDPVPANDTPPGAKTVIKAAAVCNPVANPKLLQLGPAAQTPHVNFLIGAGCAWSAQSNANWLSVEPAAGTGDATLTLRLASNEGVDTRTGTVVVGGQAITVTQSGVPCTFSATPPSLSFPPLGGSTSITLTAPAGCQWTAQNGEAAWIGATPASGSGSANVTVSAPANGATLARSGTLTLGSVLIPVAQSGITTPVTLPAPAADSCATLRLQRDGDQVAASGLTGALAFDVFADGLCAWRVKSNTSWITVTSGGGSNGNGVVSYLVEVNADFPVRSGTLSVGPRTFTINQTGASAGSGNGDSGGDGGGSSGSGGGSSGGGSG